MPLIALKPTYKSVTAYYETLHRLGQQDAFHEGAVRAAFQRLLDECAGKCQWTLVPEFPMKGPKGNRIVADGALRSRWNITQGIWEAKDDQDDLAVEVKRKFEAGYPRKNILFQAPARAILWQDGKQVLDESLEKPSMLVEVVKQFFAWEEPAQERWEQAVPEFAEKVPDIARGLEALIDGERRKNKRFIEAFAQFLQTCRTAINPNLSEEAVEKMLVQHLLTERIFRKVFDNSDFTHRNVVAQQIERVIDALTSQSFSRQQFAVSLDRYYRPLEEAAAYFDDFAEKQDFLNSIYERFFQSFDEKVADTHGVVYTPQPIVRFMVKSVEEILEREFGKSLADRDVHVLDPFVGTGNFIIHVMRAIAEKSRSALPWKFQHELHCNEVMLLPYYIASMNIEHEYFELTRRYESFEGACLVDTFELAEETQGSLFTEENTKRVEEQKRAPIFVVIGNPPYNAWQLDENDNNKNRKYKVVDKRVAETYAKDSAATLVNSLSDPYVKAFRWATDRLIKSGDEGILAYVSNNSYVGQLAFDGMRKHLAKDFDAIYVLDLGGNVRKNPKLSGTTHNVFGIQVGVSIGLFVRRKRTEAAERRAEVYYARVGEDWRKERKYQFLDEAGARGGVKWERIEPDDKYTWLTEGLRPEFEGFLPIAGSDAIFLHCTMGAKSNSDAYVYDFDRDRLTNRARRMVDCYGAELRRWRSLDRPENIDGFLQVDGSILKWIRRTKRCLGRNLEAAFLESMIQRAIYRPFVAQWHFCDPMFNEDLYGRSHAFPAGGENVAILEKTGTEWAPFALASALPVDHLPQGGAQAFPFYWYGSEDGGRRENITHWALAEFRSHYHDDAISKWDIFHYVYAILHHPAYRERYAANLKRELPRIPYAPTFAPFAEAGKRLAELHVDYEKQKEHRLKRVENPEADLSFRVDRMRLSKDKRQLVYNDFLTLDGIPPETFEYRLGNRSALEWVIDQYQVSTDARSGIVNDPNRADDEEYILRLVGQVITVSLETIKVVKALPDLGLAAE